MTTRGLPGVTVVAIVRSDTANPAPDEDFKVFPGDTLVVGGRTREGREGVPVLPHR